MRLIVLILLFVFSFSLFANTAKDSVEIIIDDSLVMVPRQVRNIAWVTPSHATTINGWSLGWMFDADGIQMDRVETINGLHTGVSPIGPIMVAFSPAILFSGQIWESIFSVPDVTWQIKPTKKLNGAGVNFIEMMNSYTINGLQISALYNSVNISNGLTVNAFAYNGEKVNGVSIAGIGSRIGEVNGVSVSGLYNINHSMKGLQIGAVNINNQAYGLQIGLFNKTKKLKGVQLGLWNKNGKFGLPIINVGW